MKTIYRKDKMLIDGNQSVPMNTENSDYQRILKEVSIGELSIEDFIEPDLPDKDLKEEARKQAFDLISKYFNSAERDDLILLMMSGKDDQKLKIMQSLEWGRKVRDEAVNNFDKPDFSKFGEPPFTYKECIK